MPVYSLRTLSITKAPIESLVDVFSYDDASGKEVARIISFKTPLDAYESNEDDSYITRRYSERLAKIEEILGDLENSFILVIV